MIEDTMKDKYYVYGIWNADGSFVTKSGEPDIVCFDNIEDALDEISVRVETNTNITWGVSKEKPMWRHILGTYFVGGCGKE